MTLEENKKIVLEALNGWGTEQMFELLSDDFELTQFVDPEASASMRILAGPSRSRDEFREVCRREAEVFQAQVRTIRYLTADEDRVAAEDVVRAQSIASPGREFQMRTLKMFYLRGGKIVRINQHLDGWYWEDYSPESISYIFGATDDLPTAAGG